MGYTFRIYIFDENHILSLTKRMRAYKLDENENRTLQDELAINQPVVKRLNSSHSSKIRVYGLQIKYI